MQDFERLLDIARRKAGFDENNPWYTGPETYLAALKSEVDEVSEEIPKHRLCYLEDELGDVLWDYLNAILALQKEAGVSVESVIQRACDKYQQRMATLEAGGSWDEIKRKQQQNLQQEYLAAQNVVLQRNVICEK
ncbi:MazG nucleotide pyrophosphohydrolase domain-containing protein [Vibrio ostreae]|uniref:Nucleotide pyrophosphohydrolase n=1 Tax=Vibrio ostreae TaxID=2841925 RepID=A0A975UDE6_9VIBR|nr:MazG nucleotide pyrophosphohydrolase domain-containing protein [Vibrio ostreae]QXO18897.1 nucleotide pyrophosphohydrolase [Vibrio ostreae]